MITAKTYPHELIGERIEVVTSKNKHNMGLKGKIIDETKMTLKIEQQGKMKTLLKNAITFRLVKSGRIIVGQEIRKRPEERIK